AEVFDEPGRRVRVALRPWPVGSAWRERAADHLNLRGHGLERVIGAGEQLQISGGGDVLPSGAELRHPEGVQVRLVADDDVTDLREGFREGGGVCRELAARLLSVRRAAAEPVPDEHED